MRRGGRLRPKRKREGVTGRLSLDRKKWDALKRKLWERARLRCEACRRMTPLDAHHIVKRSQGGADVLENLVALCRDCHQSTDNAYVDGRLVVAVQDGRPRFQTVYSSDKHTARSASASPAEPTEASDE